MTELSFAGAFEREVGRYFRRSDQEVILSWTIPYADISRVHTEGLPEVSIKFPLEEGRALTWAESFHLHTLLNRGAYYILRPLANQAAYELLLLRSNDDPT